MKRLKIIRYWLWGCMWLFPATLCAQQADSTGGGPLPDRHGAIHVTASLDSSQITVGDQVTLHIFVDGSGATPVAFPTVEALTQGAVEALTAHTDTVMDESGHIKRLDYQVTLTSFDAGKHSVGNIVVRIDGNDGAVQLSPADSLQMEVVWMDGADTTQCKMKGDVAPLNEPYTFWDIARWPVLILIAAAIVAALVWVIMRRRQNKPVFVLPKGKPVPADKRALAELEALRRKELWQKGLVKRYYTDLTDIVRRYLHAMYGIKAAEMTSRQTLRAFHSVADWSEESEALLRQLLQKADMVKFAKSQPESFEHDQAMQNAVDFVRQVAETHRINNPEKGDEK